MSEGCTSAALWMHFGCILAARVERASEGLEMAVDAIGRGGEGVRGGAGSAAGMQLGCPTQMNQCWRDAQTLRRGVRTLQRYAKTYSRGAIASARGTSTFPRSTVASLRGAVSCRRGMLTSLGAGNTPGVDVARLSATSLTARAMLRVFLDFTRSPSCAATISGRRSCRLAP